MLPAVNLATDLALAAFLAAVPLYAVRTWRRARSGRDLGLAPAFLAVLAVGWLLAAYGGFVEPNRLTVRHYPIDLQTAGARERSSLRLAVISDLHLGLDKGERWMEKVVRQVNALEPDAVILAGDLVTVWAGTESLYPLIGLESTHGTFAVLGNWDYRVGAVDVRRRVESYRTEVLTNESQTIGWEGREVRLIGLDDLKYGDPDWNFAMAEVPPGALKIAVGHEPDFVSAAEVHGIDIMVSGHTHGGQIRLPAIGAVLPMPTALPREFDRGLFDYGRVKLFISPGIGESGTRIRLFNPPEISVLDIAY